MADQLSLRPATAGQALAFVDRQSKLPLAYPYVGRTRGELPRGYRVGRRRVVLGRGRDVFTRAVEAVRGWRMFDLPWIQLYPADAKPEKGTTVALVASWAGLWSMNALRVVYAVDEPALFGFATGTLPGHLLTGEERFLVSSDADETVHFEVLAFSRPDHPLASLGLPIIRHLQHRFRTESTARFAEFVGA